MGSGSGARWLVLIIVYFAILIVTVGVIESNVSESETEFDEYYGETRGVCGDPRNIYFPYEEGVVYRSGIGEPSDVGEFTTSNDKKVSFPDYVIGYHIECKYSSGVLSNESCEDINGCRWDVDQSLLNTFLSLFGVSDTDNQETCVGRIDYADFPERWTILDGKRVSTKTENPAGDSICYHPDVFQNRTLCEKLSCTWDSEKSVDDLEVEGVKPSKGLVDSMWGTTKEMLTFSYDFGFENAQASYIVNFLLFYTPLISGILSLYVMVRS